MEPGIYDGISNDDYQTSEGISTSFLKVFADSPRKARFGVHKTTNALEKGTLVHTAILEPENLEKQYQPTRQERTGTRAWDDEERLSMGRKLIKYPDWEMALRMRDAVHNDYEAHELLSGTKTEQAFWYRDPDTGVLRRGKADAINDSFRAIVDVKTCENSHRDAFYGSVAKYRYHWQEASYTDGWHLAGGWKPQGFVFLAIEKEEPFLVGKYRLQPEDIDEARFDLRKLMPQVARCLETNVWPTNRDGVVVLDRLPKRAHLKYYTEGN